MKIAGLSWFLFLQLLCWPVIGQASPSDSLRNELNESIRQAGKYDEEKLASISQLKQSLKSTPAGDLAARYALHAQLYDEYKYYNYDSALAYSNQLIHFATDQNNPGLIADAEIKKVFILLSGGLFKETFELLSAIKIDGIADSIKAEYYSLKARCYFDLSDFNADPLYAPVYNSNAIRYTDSSLLLYPVNSFEYLYFLSLKQLKTGRSDSAVANLKKLIASTNLTYHEVALATSTLGGIFMGKGDNAAAKDYLVRASIADIRSSTKETLALLNLASMIYKEGEIKDAALYIEKANADASFYNARLRKVQIGAILPLIEGEMINTIEVQKQKLWIYLLLLGLLALALAAFGIIIRNQVKKLKVARENLLGANLRLQLVNEQLVEANAAKERYNQQLKQINNQLSEANTIKEEYIGYYFTMDTQFLTRIEKLIASVEKKIAERKWEEIRFILKNVDLKKEKEELLKNFDTVFIRLFPNFVAQFNSLFQEEDRIILKDNQLLNAELRIFALIRLGITQNEKIAEILDYSINTIYSKKTKIRSKTIVAKDSFEEKLMEITALNFKETT